MNPEQIQQIFTSQKNRRWQLSQSTAEHRMEKLRRLKQAVLKTEDQLKAALFADFKKPAAEVELTEIFVVIEEINHTLKHLKSWMRPKKIKTPLALLGSRTEIRSEARGLALIMAPWNYPFQLFMNPIIAALAAGNAVMARPSDKVPATSRYMKHLLESIFPTNEVAVIEGGIETAEFLLTLPFDHFFFTGSTAIGRKVALSASQHLASVTLELGGKSPVIILDDADLAMAAERIVWAKFLNAGQTCVAPDHVYVPENRADEFLHLCKERISQVFGKTSAEQKKSPNLARIIDPAAFTRLQGAYRDTVQAGAVSVIGGDFDAPERFISPTLLDQVKPDHALMNQEIFGPILPVLRYQKTEEVISHLQSQEKPLALYLFGKDHGPMEEILKQTSAGGSVINHLALHLINNNAPFGGVGGSGQGSYHGQYGFKAFSHERTVLHQGPFSLSSWLFPPYNTNKFKLLLGFLKWLSK